MEVTPQFRTTLAESLAPLRAGTGHTSINQARKAVGQAQRLAQVVPEAQPWAAAMWAALTAALHAEGTSRKEAPPGRLPASRFATAARWFLTLLEGAVLPLRRVVSPKPSPHRKAGRCGLIFDASPWGWGAVRTDLGRITHWARGTWDTPTLTRFHATVGDPAWQGFW